MRLTIYQRRGMVQDILRDIPVVDYDQMMRARVEKIAVDAMPPGVRSVWRNRETRHYIRLRAYYLDCISMNAPGYDGSTEGRQIFDADEELKALHAKRDQQVSDRDTLAKRLSANLAACGTDKVVRERFPDLAKYLPEPATVANLPVATDLMDALKAAGLKVGAA